jgi:hypothetical protein
MIGSTQRKCSFSISERHIAEIVVPKLVDFLLGNKRRGRAHLSVITDDQNLLAAQKGRKLGDIGLRSFVDDHEVKHAELRRKLLGDAPGWHNPAR